MIAAAEQMRDASCARPEYQGLPWIAENPSAANRARMAAVCAACPVLATCAAEVAAIETTAGFWAGEDHTVPEPPVQGMLQLDLGTRGHLDVDPHQVHDLGEGWVLLDPHESPLPDGSTGVGGILAKVRVAA
jgi:hypothetical protein